MRRAFKRRHKAGELLSPCRNLYAPPEYWQGLNVCEQSLHVARGLALLHPDWVFAGLTAADAYGFDHSWNLHDDAVYRVDTFGYGTDSRNQVHRAPAAHRDQQNRRSGKVAGPCELQYETRRLYIASTVSKQVNGIMVTDEIRTLVDCGLSMPFLYALPIFDSAARKGVDLGLVSGACKGLHADCGRIETLLQYVDARSENGGESMVRAAIIDYGFAVPDLQVEFCDPRYPARRYRVDFLWRLHDGRMIVLEYDGMAKYEDPNMTQGRTAKRILNERNERDRALCEAGVTTILHCTYEDALVTNGLLHMLKDAGVPQVRPSNQSR